MTQDTFDIVFVGGGAAGCVAAGQLAAANPALRILILEAGPHSYNVDTHTQPARYSHNLLNPNEKSKSFTLHVAHATEAVAKRNLVVPAGRVLGGGSAVNFMVYTRAAASDYDTWEQVHKNPGWGSKDLIPLLKKIETYTLPTVNSTHGRDGPIRISFPKGHTNVGQQFLDIAGAYDKDRSVVPDWNDFKTSDGYGVWAKYINDKTGRRSDTAHAFVYSQMDNTNLVVSPESRVIRVLFKGTQAVGVEYVAGEGQNPVLVLASRLVVLSAGTFGSPSILERSGIGAAEVLGRNGITQLVDLPGVGEKYNDHNVVFTHYTASQGAETVDHIFHGSEESLQVHDAQWKETGKGLLAHNGLNAGFKIRPTSEDVEAMGPAFEKNLFLQPSPISLFIGPSPPSSTGKYFNILYVLTYPASTGRVHILHGLDPFGPLDFCHGYLDEEADVVLYRWMYKHVREIARRMPVYRGELRDWHPTFPAGSEATPKDENKPVDVDAPKLTYTAEDDAAIDEYHRRKIGTAWHSLGTCAMKPRSEGGVVDSSLNVYGTTQLKVADLSICPENVGANTYNTALAVGAKAAVLIAEDLGLNL